jgi:hypothetical protein
MTPAIYHKIVANSALSGFHDYRVRAELSEERLFLVKSPVRGIFTGYTDRETAMGAGRRKIVGSTGTLFGRNTQS